MRCPDCNKFVSYDDEYEIETSESIDEDGHAEVEVEVGLNCMECGTRLKEATMTFEGDYECPECGSKDLDLEDVDTSSCSRVDTLGKNGQPLKSSRGWKTYYGADLTLNFKCNDCEHEWAETDVVDEQASSFEECC